MQNIDALKANKIDKMQIQISTIHHCGPHGTSNLYLISIFWCTCSILFCTNLKKPGNYFNFNIVMGLI